MIKPQITSELISEWTQETADQLKAGWSTDSVRRNLTKKGCTPKVLEHILRNAKSSTVAANRKSGVGSVMFGFIMLCVGLGVIVIEAIVLKNFGAGIFFWFPVILILTGALAILKGLAQTIIGGGS
jgi:hypothetical protein